MDPNIIYAWAVAYRKAGWVVLPAKNKHPIGNWKQYQTQVPTMEETQAWFEDVTEDTQIALVTGAISGVSVVDVDCHKEGCAYKKNQICNCSPNAPEYFLTGLHTPLVSRTGSGGYHAFFKYDQRVTNSVKLAHPQLDIRSEGGIIILPPSSHDTLPKDYEWIEEGWSFEKVNELPAFPENLIGMLKERPRIVWAELTAGTLEGGRHDATIRLAAKLVAAFSPEDLVPVWELMRAWNKQNVHPALPEEEIKRTIVNAAKMQVIKRAAEYGK